MNKRKVYIVGGYGADYVNWMESQIVKNIEDADFVVGIGGADVHWKWYYEGKNPHPTLGMNYQLDVKERKEFERAIELNLPLVGVCRSAQHLCVIAGGKLVQHQENPSFYHFVKTREKDTILVTSTHHNAQHPYNLNEGEDFIMLNWTEGHPKYKWLDADVESTEKREAETVYYPKIKALAIQPHIEMIFGQKNEEFDKTIIYYRDLLSKLLENKL